MQTRLGHRLRFLTATRTRSKGAAFDMGWFTLQKTSIYTMLMIVAAVCTGMLGARHSLASPAVDDSAKAADVAPLKMSAESWRIVDQGDKEGPSVWRFPGKGVRQESNIYGGSGTLPDPLRPGTFAVYKEQVPADGAIRLKLLSFDNDAVGVMFRYRDPDNYYRFFWDRQRSIRRLDRVRKGAVSVLASDNVPYEKGRVYRLSIVSEQDRIEILVDDRPVFSVQDPTLHEGAFALYCWGNAGSVFFDIEQVRLSAGKAADPSGPDVAVLQPTSESHHETADHSVRLSGTAADADGVREVRWANSAGGAGIAIGTDTWKIPLVPLDPGENRIRLIGIDKKGRQNISTLVVTRLVEEMSTAGAETRAEDARLSKESAQEVYRENDQSDSGIGFEPPLPESAPVSGVPERDEAAESEKHFDPDSGKQPSEILADAEKASKEAISSAGPENQPQAARQRFDPNATDGYRIGSGDVLEISLWKDEALTRLVTVMPDGRIFFPLIGKIEAAGKTVEQVHHQIESMISRYVPEPVLHVSVQQVNSMLVYVIGRVNRPGHFPIHQNVNVLQALSMAGGLNPFAKKKEIRIYRQNGKETETFEFDYQAVSEGENIAQNILLERGDVIVVP